MENDHFSRLMSFLKVLFSHFHDCLRKCKYSVEWSLLMSGKINPSFLLIFVASCKNLDQAKKKRNMVDVIVFERDENC